jgi:hypothetical protein
MSNNNNSQTARASRIELALTDLLRANKRYLFPSVDPTDEELSTFLAKPLAQALLLMSLNLVQKMSQADVNVSRNDKNGTSYSYSGGRRKKKPV